MDPQRLQAGGVQDIIKTSSTKVKHLAEATFIALWRPHIYNMSKSYYLKIANNGDLLQHVTVINVTECFN